MTNKPMLSVERELLATAMKADASMGASAIELVNGWAAMEELRALLDKPVDDPNLGIEMMRGAGSGILIQDHGAGWEAVTFNRGIRVSSFPIKGGYKETVVALKAARHQGEPVAELQVAFFEHGSMARINWFTPSAFEPGATKLYAGQSAPVVTVSALMRAIHEIEGFPGVTGDQLRELAARLNGIKPKQ